MLGLMGEDGPKEPKKAMWQPERKKEEKKKKRIRKNLLPSIPQPFIMVNLHLLKSKNLIVLILIIFFLLSFNFLFQFEPTQNPNFSLLPVYDAPARTEAVGGSFGVHDTMRYGRKSARGEIAQPHPLEFSEGQV